MSCSRHCCRRPKSHQLHCGLRDGGQNNMSVLHDVIGAVDRYARASAREVERARKDPSVRKSVLARWQQARSRIGTTTTPTGLKLPRLALPDIDDPGEIARYLYEQGLPGEFPFVNSIYPEMYLEPAGQTASAVAKKTEEPMRLFAGLGLPDDTNARF